MSKKIAIPVVGGKYDGTRHLWTGLLEHGRRCYIYQPEQISLAEAVLAQQPVAQIIERDLSYKLHLFTDELRQERWVLTPPDWTGSQILDHLTHQFR